MKRGRAAGRARDWGYRYELPGTIRRSRFDRRWRIRMAAYESDLTRFIRDLKRAKPGIERAQREGRAIWWDKQLDLDEQQRWRDARVPQRAYVYQTEPKK